MCDMRCGRWAQAKSGRPPVMLACAATWRPRNAACSARLRDGGDLARKRGVIWPNRQRNKKGVFEEKDRHFNEEEEEEEKKQQQKKLMVTMTMIVKMKFGLTCCPVVAGARRRRSPPPCARGHGPAGACPP